MIKCKFTFLMLFCFMSFNASSVTAETQIEQEVLEAFNQLVTASKNLDAENYFKLIDEEKFIGLNSDGTNWNSIEELKPLITSGFSAIKTISSLEFTNVKISVIDRSIRKINAMYYPLCQLYLRLVASVSNG